MRIPPRRWLSVAVAIGLGGCAAFPVDRGLKDTQGLVVDRGGPTIDLNGPKDCADPAAGIDNLLADSLTAEIAVRVALLCNPGLAADYARLGIARAEAFQAGRLANPTLSISALDSSAGGATSQLGAGIAQSFTSLILRGPRQRMAEGEFLRAQQLLAGSVLTLAVEVKTAYYRLIAAQQVAALRDAAAEAAHTSAALALAFQKAGNLSARELALDNANAAQIDADARVAGNAEADARAALRLLLGVAADQSWSVPDALPLPVDEEDPHQTVPALADRQRLDLLAARKLVELLADSAQSARKYRFLGEFTAGVDYERESDRSRLLGPTLSIQLPLFDAGQGTVARANALKDWSEAERRRLTLQVANAVDLNCRRVHSAREQVEDYRMLLIPQRAAVVTETQKEVNFMLRGVFELIAVKRDEYGAYEGYIGALRDYWVARADLERAVGARLPSDDHPTTGNVSIKEILTPKDDMAGMHHMHHGATNNGSMQEGSMKDGAMDHGTMDHGKTAPSSQEPAKNGKPAVEPENTPPHQESHSPHSAGDAVQGRRS